MQRFERSNGGLNVCVGDVGEAVGLSAQQGLRSGEQLLAPFLPMPCQAHTWVASWLGWSGPPSCVTALAVGSRSCHHGGVDARAAHPHLLFLVRGEHGSAASAQNGCCSIECPSAVAVVDLIKLGSGQAKQQSCAA